MGGQTDADVAIVGSGIIGTISAIALQAAGFSVVVIEPDEPGAGTAAGSGGYLHDGEIYPVARPALLAALPGMLFDPRGPLVVRPSYLPQFAGWGMRFLGAMRASTVARATSALASLNRTAVADLASVAVAAGADDLLVRRGGLKIVCDARSLDELATELKDLDREGIAARALDAAEVHKIEPALGANVAGAILFPNSAHCIDPDLFGKRLAEHVRTNGRFIRARVHALLPQPDGTWIVNAGATQSISAQRVLVAAGYDSAALLRPLGYSVPVAAARGYHLMIPNPGVELNHPMIFHEPHVAATPMSAGVRLAGTMEFASPDSPPDFQRAQMLYGLAQRYIPELRNGAATQWAGVRPSMPDSIPAMGAARHHRNLFYCFGHGHLGFTQAAVSANAMARLIGGTPPDIDLTPFDLARFHS